MRKFLIIPILILSILTWRCDNIKHENIDTLSKEFLSFKNGSNWLYQEDSTGIQQYLYVDKYYRTMVQKQIDSNDYLDETIEMTIRSADSSTCTQKMTLFWFGISESFGNTYNYYSSIENYNGYNFSSEKIISLNVMGNTYNNVCHIVDKTAYYSAVNQNFVNEYWIAKNKWIIKKIIRTPTGNWYWSLKKCNIVQ